MKKRAAIIKSGKVENVILLDENWTGASKEWQAPEGTSVVFSDVAGMGDSYDGSIFTPVPKDDSKEIAKMEAFERAKKDIKDNKNTTPWGKILYDLAIARGWIEE